METDRKVQTIAKVTKVFVPVLIAVAIVVIWHIKTGEEQTAGPSPQESGLIASKADLSKWKAYGLPVIVAFGRGSDPASKEMLPVLMDLNAEYRGRALIKYVDLAEYPDAAEDFPVPVVPALFFFDKDGGPFVPGDPQAMGMTMHSDGGDHVLTVHLGGMNARQIRAVLAEMGVQ